MDGIEVTREHVPPKGLFARPLPSNLPTIPACSSCNGGASQDDEYLKQTLSLHHRAHDHPDATFARQGVLRSRRRPEQQAFWRRFLSGMHETELVTPGGLYLGRTGRFLVDNDRLGRIVVKIMRGLYFHHVRRPLRADARTIGLLFIGESPVPEPLFSQARSLPHVRRVGSAFGYRYAVHSTDPTRSAWLMLFYGAIVGLAASGPTFEGEGDSAQAD